MFLQCSQYEPTVDNFAVSSGVFATYSALRFNYIR